MDKRKILRMYAIYSLPAFLIHELSHWVVAKLLFVKTNSFVIHVTYGEGVEKETREGYVVTTTSNNALGIIKSVMISAAPTIAWFLMVCGLFVDSLWWLYLYAITTPGTMTASDGDKKNIAECLVKLFTENKQKTNGHN